MRLSADFSRRIPTYLDRHRPLAAHYRILAVWFVYCELRFAPEIVWPVITMSPSFKSPSTTSVADPSLRPTLILRDRVCHPGPTPRRRGFDLARTGADAGAKPAFSHHHLVPLASALSPCWRLTSTLALPLIACRHRSIRCPFASCGVNRSAEFGTFNTLLRSSIVIVKFAVIPGFSFCSGLSTLITTL